MFTEQTIIDKELYLVFQCVYYEDGIYPEYEFVGAHFNKIDAEKQFESLNNGIFKPSNKIINHKINYDSNAKPLFWNTKYNSWTDEGCFISVDFPILLRCLNEHQINAN